MADFSNMEWRFTGFDSTTKIFEFKVPQAELDETGVKRVLELLIARHLEPEEALYAALGKNPLLEVKSDSTRGNRVSYWGGQNPHFIAGLFRKDEK